MQGRGNRGGRANYSSRHIPHGGSRNALSGKENEINQGADDGVVLPAPQDKKNKETSVVARCYITSFPSLLIYRVTF
ncbi:hypothetical protein Ccrd_019622 [Cynara cardunculus var. scolymus]|uniref:Uncharacterized protein n=1 Tax=Cynara cardunculus var. scolymus TaxID=59895 RepID=A0A124SF49_CYNCS|nr:hypothetical protein Ccrd_019622 [Cynara cardunculus var. scolymus]